MKKTIKVVEHFAHDVCPKCGNPSVPAESVPDQSFRGCPHCSHTWTEDLSRAATQPSQTTDKATAQLAGFEVKQARGLAKIRTISANLWKNGLRSESDAINAELAIAENEHAALNAVAEAAEAAADGNALALQSLGLALDKLAAIRAGKAVS